MARFHQGEPIRYVRNGQKKFTTDYIVELTDSTIVTRNDTLPILSVTRLDIGERPEKNFKLKSSGYKLITIGLLLPISDYLAITKIQNEEYEFNKALGIVSAAIITTGVVMAFFSRPIIRMNRKNRLRVIGHDSVFYR